MRSDLVVRKNVNQNVGISSLNNRIESNATKHIDLQQCQQMAFVFVFLFSLLFGAVSVVLN